MKRGNLRFLSFILIAVLLLGVGIPVSGAAAEYLKAYVANFELRVDGIVKTPSKGFYTIGAETYIRTRDISEILGFGVEYKDGVGNGVIGTIYLTAPEKETVIVKVPQVVYIPGRTVIKEVIKEVEVPAELPSRNDLISYAEVAIEEYLSQPENLTEEFYELLRTASLAAIKASTEEEIGEATAQLKAAVDYEPKFFWDDISNSEPEPEPAEAPLKAEDIAKGKFIYVGTEGDFCLSDGTSFPYPWNPIAAEFDGVEGEGQYTIVSISWDGSKYVGEVEKYTPEE